MPSHTADYWYLELALAERERAFTILEAEMMAFKPLPLESFDSKKAEIWDELRKDNPGQNVQDLGFLVDKLIVDRYSPGMQFMNRFMESFAAEQVAITIISHALCEAIINAVLAIGLSSQGQQSLFPILERSRVKDKWMVAPRVFLPVYAF